MKTGVLVMAYGTPTTPENIEPYYTLIRHGRPPTPELLGTVLNCIYKGYKLCSILYIKQSILSTINFILANIAKLLIHTNLMVIMVPDHK